MTEKKIAECINVRVNVGNYQHIELTKYAEKTISYNNEEEMVRKEDELTEELVANLIRNMRRIPERLGKDTTAVIEVEESIAKVIPEWLQNGDVPNLANKALTGHNKTVAEQKEERDSHNIVEEKKEVLPEDLKEVVAKKPSNEMDDLFDGDDDLFSDN